MFPNMSLRIVRRLWPALALVTCVGAGLAAQAGARNVYVIDFGLAAVPGSIPVIDSQANTLVGSPLKFVNHPLDIAIAPDGKTAYIPDEDPNTKGPELLMMDTRTNQMVGSPIPLKSFPSDIAVSPDGRRVYLANFATDDVSVVETQTNRLLEPPIKVGDGPEGIAVSPDGTRAYVTNRDSKTVSVFNAQSDLPIATLPVEKKPEGIAITPDGKRIYVANDESNTVSVIDTATNGEVPGSPIAVGEEPEGVAISPNGKLVYVSNFGSNSVSVIDTQANRAVAAIPVGEEPEGLAFTPDGKTAYVANLVNESTSVIDVAAGAPLGAAVKGGFLPGRVAIVPDQPPLAAFSHPVIRPGVPVAFDASASRDPDGSVANFAWSFGDGATAPSGGPSPSHAFTAPGSYAVTLTLTDNEGCSTALIFTGQTASCNGSAAATRTVAVDVAYPAVGVRCPARAKPKGCLFKLRAVTKVRKGKPETAVARVKVKAGKSASVSLKPKPHFAPALATASSVLVKRTVKFGGVERTTFHRLKIVG
jgi:YVTN family beta-propeller protein